MADFDISLKAWGGAAGRTLIQGLRIHKPSGTIIVHQADDIPGQTEQNIVFRAHNAAEKYLGAVTVKRAGHGSSVGLESVSGTSCRLWLGHEGQNGTGYVTYSVGQTGTVSFIKAAGLERGDVSVDQPRDLLCLRTGNRYRGYSLASINAGEPKRLWDLTIPPWGERFQGHMVFAGSLYVHRDVKTGGPSRAHQYDYTGKQTGSLDTTELGDEAEGFVEVNNTIYVVKRTGGSGAGRIVEATRWLTVVPPKGEPPVTDYVMWRGVKVSPDSVDSLNAIAQLSGPNIFIRPTQGGYNAGGVTASAGTHDGAGAVDLSVAGWSKPQIDAVVRLARECGWSATWFRPYIRGLWPSHIHMIQNGITGLSAGAAGQLAAVKRGRNGLANSGRDTGPLVLDGNGKKWPTWATSIHNPANKPETLADVYTRLGPLTDVSPFAVNAARGTGKPSRHVAIMQHWLNLALPDKPLDVDGVWSAKGPTQDKLDQFRRTLGWVGADIGGPAGAHSLTELRNMPAVAATNPLPVRPN